MFDAAEWHDYFVMVGGAAAALTGLVFVAMSLHLSDITSDPAHRHRARTILIAVTTVFVRCGLVLMGGQSIRAVGIEIFIVVLGAEVVVSRSLIEALRTATGPQHAVLSRTLGYAVCLIVEQAGAVVMSFGHAWGLYPVAAAMAMSFLYVVGGAWLLLVSVEEEPRADPD